MGTPIALTKHKITQEYNLDGGIQATTTDGKVQEQAQFRSRKNTLDNLETA